LRTPEQCRNHGAPFGIAGIWENWKEPASGEWIPNLTLARSSTSAALGGGEDMPPFTNR
jgi:putative SOS response-associated peptidase YedK